MSYNFFIHKFWNHCIATFDVIYKRGDKSRLSYANMGNISRVSQILQQQNMRNAENICQYCTRQRAITTLSLNAYLDKMYQELSYLLIVSGLLNII